MPSPYTRALTQARQVTLKNGKLVLSRLQSVFESVASKAEDIIGTSTSAYQVGRAASIRSQVLDVLSATEIAARATILRQRGLTVDDVVNIHKGVVTVLTEQPSLVAARFGDLPTRVLATLASQGSSAANYKTLINRHMAEARDSLDAIIQGGIGTGQSASSLASDIASLIVGEDIKAGAYGLDPTDVSGLKSIWYDSRRIAVTEINNAYRESNHQSLESSGMIAAVQWQLSGAHSIDDECDDLAEGSSDGYDAGFYTLDEWPEAPHPFCMCGQGDVQFLPVEDWDFQPPDQEEEG